MDPLKAFCGKETETQSTSTLVGMFPPLLEGGGKLSPSPLRSIGGFGGLGRVELFDHAIGFEDGRVQVALGVDDVAERDDGGGAQLDQAVDLGSVYEVARKPALVKFD